MYGRLHPEFEPLLAPFKLAHLERHPGSVYGLWPDLTLAYVNPAWARFAAQNFGQPGIAECWGLGAELMEATPPILQPFYRGLYDRCLEDGQPQQHDYEACSRQLYRRFHMTVHPLRRGPGFLVVNTLTVESPHVPEAREPMPARPEPYEDDGGVLHQCAHCRRFRNLCVNDRWDWVPAWVDVVPPATAPDLCDACRDHYAVQVWELAA
ncbi:MAG: hypothetical protein HZB25_12530 [Candidatus Eisenbacteria bacterium]|nr:hypothetical protein [Candidatus Eisenbacteria bacterium]